MTQTSVDFDTELSGLRAMLEPDGFGIEASSAGPEGLDLRLTMLSPEACVDCIVPKPVMERLIAAELEPYQLSVSRLTYPGEETPTAH